ncbi:MAG TPA: hydroxylase, partial [Candidatus Binatia bacterium]|nr:hydroxylase [Candidatus Binatia bacterium]
VGEIWREAISTGAVNQDSRAALRLATTHAIRLAVEVVDTIYQAAGVTAIYEGNQLQRYFQDIHVISQHLQGRLAHYELVGKHSLGFKIDPSRL